MSETDDFWDNWKYPKDFTGNDIQKVDNAIKILIKNREKKVVEIVDSCRVWRNTFITKKELIRKLEEAFPEK